MSALVSVVMVHEFDLHPTMFLMIHNTVDRIREDQSKLQAVVVALREKLSDVDLAKVGAQLEIERAAASRAGVNLPDGVASNMIRLQALLRNLQMDIGNGPDEIVIIAESEEQETNLRSSAIGTYCSLIDGVFECVRESEALLPLLPDLAGLSQTDGCAVGGLQHSSTHGALCKYALQLTSLISSVVRIGLRAVSQDVGPPKMPSRGKNLVESASSGITSAKDLSQVDQELILKLYAGDSYSCELMGPKLKADSTVRNHLRKLRALRLLDHGDKPYRLSKKGRAWAQDLS